MVQGALSESKAAWAAAVTGIAGARRWHERETPWAWSMSPVGNAERIDVQKETYPPVGREPIRYRSAVCALNMLRVRLCEDKR